MAEEECNTNLSLAIDGGRQFMPGHRSKPTLQLQVLFPHHPKEEEEEEPIRIPRSKNTEEEEVISGRDSSNCSNDRLFGTRKKLKLTKEQVSLLEDRFREHNTLNTVSPEYYLLHDSNRSEFCFLGRTMYGFHLHAGSEARSRRPAKYTNKTGGSLVPEQKSKVIQTHVWFKCYGLWDTFASIKFVAYQGLDCMHAGRS